MKKFFITYELPDKIMVFCSTMNHLAFVTLIKKVLGSTKWGHAIMYKNSMFLITRNTYRHYI